MTAAAEYRIDFDDLDDVVAREYLRVSFDASGRVRSNEEQHDENGPAITRRGWTLGEPYEDVGSASKFQRKRRPDFDRLLADLEAGSFGAHVLVLWEGSRGSRKVSEWSRMLEACEATGVRIFVTSDRALYDVSSPRDWKTLMDDAVASEHEVRKTSKRGRRSSNANAKAGTFSGGRRPYGYEPDGVTIRDGRVEGTNDERQVIRDAVDAVLAGVPVRAIAADLNARGVPTSTGKAWHPNVLGNLLASPRIAGKRVHQAVVVGDAVWPGIIDEITHKRVVAVLASRSPMGRRGRTPWLLTGLVACGRCHANLVGNTEARTGTRRYVCRKGPGQRGCGGLVVKANDIEAALGIFATDRLADAKARAAAVVGPDDADDIADLDEIAVMRAEAAEDRARGPRNGGLDREGYNAAIAALDRRQRDVEARLAAKVRDVVRFDFIDADEFAGRSWLDYTPAEKRRVLDAMIERVNVGPASVRGLNRFEVERVDPDTRIVWRVPA